MALSCYSNWGGEPDQQHLNSEITMFSQPQPSAAELYPELLGFNPSVAFSDPYIDSILESQDSFYSDNCTSLLPYFSSSFDEKSNDLYSVFPEVFSEDQYDPYPNSKRQKNFEGCYNNVEIVPPELFSRFIPNPPLLRGLTPEILTPFPGSIGTDIPVFISSKNGGHDEPFAKKGGNEGGTLSAQSIAARQRRRKITEKTQELGKLIPGGQKMNTAEMFHAAFKYIKFLQAQVGILEAMASVQENGESFQHQELNPLLGSSLLQEKLYSMEKCLVPQKLVQSLVDDSNTKALNEFKELIGIGG